MVEGAGRGWLGLPVEGVGEVVAAGLELCQFVPELFGAGAAGGVVHGLVLERRVVSVDLCLGGGELSGDGVDLGVPSAWRSWKSGWAGFRFESQQRPRHPVPPRPPEPLWLSPSHQSYTVRCSVSTEHRTAPDAADI